MDPATGSYPEPDESSTHSFILFPYDLRVFSYYPLNNACIVQVGSFLKHFLAIIIIIIIIIIEFFIYLRAKVNSQWPITVSTNTKTAMKHRIKRTKNNKNKEVDQLRLLTLKHKKKIWSYLQTAFAAETHPAGGDAERGKVTYVLSRNTNDDCVEDRGAKFSATKYIY
jgi:hypothetical protein